MARAQDGIERLECVYYAHPIPSSPEVLTILSIIFDKIHFPGVYLPKGDYDKEALGVEIDRLEKLPNRDAHRHQLIGMLRFLPLRAALDGILEFPTPEEEIFGRTMSSDPMELYNAMYPPRENWEPILDKVNSKGLPNSEESISYLGAFYYPVEAISYASKKALPLINDEPRLPLLGDQNYKLDASSLAMILAMECVQLTMPEMPQFLTAQEITEFRIENKGLLRAFRSSMLRYAKDLNEALDDGSPSDAAAKTNFLIETEIKPALHDLRQALNAPSRSWSKRIEQTGKFVARLTFNCLTGNPLTGASSAASMLEFLTSEMASKGEKNDAIRRSGLYYLLLLENIGSR